MSVNNIIRIYRMQFVLGARKRLLFTLLTVFITACFLISFLYRDKNALPIELMRIEERRLERLNLAKTVCNNHVFLDSVEDDDHFVTRMRFVEEANLVYCENFKMASSMMAEQLVRMRASNVEDMDNAHPAAAHYFGLTDKNALDEIIGQHERILALIVRDPLERLWSAYNDKVRPAPTDPVWSRVHFSMRFPNTTLDSLDDVNLYSDALSPSFLEFALHIIDNACNKTEPCTLVTKPVINPHWKPVHINCNFCAIPFNFIMKTETLDEDLELLNALTGLKLNSGRRVNTKKRNDFNLVQKLYEEVNETVVRRLVEVFQYDFKLFDYDPSVYLNMPY